MSLNAAIEKQRAALLRIVMTLFSHLGIAPGGVVFAAPSPMLLFVERVLLSAESAAYWLVVAQARAIGAVSLESRESSVRFNLSHRHDLHSDAALEDANVVRAERLCARLNALHDILSDIRKHARRLIVVVTQKSVSPASRRLSSIELASDRPVGATPRCGLDHAARYCLAVPGLDSS